MCLQEPQFHTAMDEEMYFGLVVDDERDEYSEIRETLASFDLKYPGGTYMMPSHDCHFKFELVQQDADVFKRADGSKGATFVLKATVQSKSRKLTGAELQFSAGDPASFLYISMPPDGAEFVTPQEVDGIIEVREGKPGLYIGYQTLGAASCGSIGSQNALVRLDPDQSTQEVGCLSVVVLVCLPDASKMRYDMDVSVQASLSNNSFLRGWRKSRRTIGNRKVQLALI